MSLGGEARQRSDLLDHHHSEPTRGPNVLNCDGRDSADLIAGGAQGSRYLQQVLGESTRRLPSRLPISQALFLVTLRGAPLWRSCRDVHRMANRRRRTIRRDLASVPVHRPTLDRRTVLAQIPVWLRRPAVRLDNSPATGVDKANRTSAGAMMPAADSLAAT
jgi:hypothetical protein